MKSAREKLREVYDMPGMPDAARVIIGDVMSSLSERPEGEWIYEASISRVLISALTAVPV